MTPKARLRNVRWPGEDLSPGLRRKLLASGGAPKISPPALFPGGAYSPDDDQNEGRDQEVAKATPSSLLPRHEGPESPQQPPHPPFGRLCLAPRSLGSCGFLYPSAGPARVLCRRALHPHC